MPLDHRSTTIEGPAILASCPLEELERVAVLAAARSETFAQQLHLISRVPAHKREQALRRILVAHQEDLIVRQSSRRSEGLVDDFESEKTKLLKRIIYNNSSAVVTMLRLAKPDDVQPALDKLKY